MKLTCDLCGGELEMTVGGSGAVCRSCGLEYAPDRLREKQSEMQKYANTAQAAAYTPVNKQTAQSSKKNGVKRTVLVILWAIIGLVCFIGTLTAESPEQEGTVFIGCLAALLLTLIIFKPWKIFGGKP